MTDVPLPEPLCRDDTEHDKDYFTADQLRSYGEARAQAERAKFADLIVRAQAVVARWETPLWKHAKPTAAFIYALRDALAGLDAPGHAGAETPAAGKL